MKTSIAQRLQGSLALLLVLRGCFNSPAQSGGAPVITQNPANQATAAGTPITLNVQATGDAPLHYQWRFNGVNLPPATNHSLTLPNPQFFQSGAYDAVVS